MTMRLGILHLLFFGIEYCYSQDPCITYQPLPRAIYRGTKCTRNTVNDRILLGVSKTWYKADGPNGPLEMVNSTVFRGCGAEFPIYLVGGHPSNINETVMREACIAVTNACDVTRYGVEIKNCGDYFVYNLQQPAFGGGFCFGESDPCPPFDPCDSFGHEVWGDVEGRSINCRLSIREGDSGLQDGWYQIRGNNDEHLTIPSTCPGTGQCSAESPIWIQGPNPSVDDDIVDTSACVNHNGSCCSRSFTVHVKNCTNFLVYNLTSTNQNERYCTVEQIGSCPGSSIPTTTSTLSRTAAESSETTGLQVNSTASTHWRRDILALGYFGFSMIYWIT